MGYDSTTISLSSYHVFAVYNMSESSLADLDGDVHCPECGYTGQEYTTKRNIVGQDVLECPECSHWQ